MQSFENKDIKTNSMETGRITNAREHLRKINKCGIQQRGRIYIYIYKNTSKQTGYCSYETVNTVKIQIRIQNHRSAAQDPIKHQ